MAPSINEVMTHDPRTVSADSTLTDAARIMRDADVGAIVVERDGAVAGIVTDRDIVVRAIADGRDPETAVGEIASRDIRTVSPDDPVEAAISILREDEVRRVPVVQDGRPVGIVSIGDLAIERDADSALADISASPPSN